MSKELIKIRNKTFETFKNKVNSFNEKQCDEFLIDNAPENALGDESLQEKKDFILDLECNYISQAKKEDLLSVYK